MRYVIIALAILFSMPIWTTAGEPPVVSQFFVSSAGYDANPGTQEKPFASLKRAQDAVRQLVASGLRGDLKVLIRQGFYELSEPLVFGPEDSGSEQFAISYAAEPGGNVILSGGKKISGWKRGEGEIWTVAVPGVAEGKWYFRNLFVHGKRAVRARTPNQDAQPNCLQLKGAELTKDRTRFTLTVAPGVLGDGTTPPTSRSWSPGTGKSTASGSKASTRRETASCWPRHTNQGRTTSSPARADGIIWKTPASYSTSPGSGTWIERPAR